MRVAQILYSGLGGHGGVAFGLIDGDVHRELEWTLGFLGVEPLLEDYVRRCEQRRLTCRYLPAIAGAPWRGWPGILRWLRNERPKAVILHNTTAVFPCALYARSFGVPLVVVEHQQNKLKRREDWIASRFAMRFADRVVVLTEDYAAGLAERLGRQHRERKVRIIPNGLDLDLFSPASLPPLGVIRIGMAARFTRTKRFDLLIEAVAELRRSRPLYPYRLTLAGTGETWEESRRAADRLGVTDLVTFEGALAEVELANWYRTLHIYAHASEGESLSMSLLQAMATALPIVASDVPGISSLLRPFAPEGASLVGAPTSDAFAAAIALQADNLDSARGAAQESRNACVRQYGNRTMFGRYKAALDELVRPASSPRMER